MTRATGIGSLPGDDFAEASRIVLGEIPGFPHLPELPARGAIADMTGRTLAMIGELGFDLQPAGWRLTDASGIDHRRAKSLLAQDLDVFEELTQGYEGPLKLQVAGPWTVAATTERPRGDRLLADVGARREVAEALALGGIGDIQGNGEGGWRNFHQRHARQRWRGRGCRCGRRIGRCHGEGFTVGSTMRMTG